ncbi:tellurium resistance protein TerC [Mycolicibacter minnesotensis]|uniref:Tellurium resistance protein TerC n=1 Tax=Mycolicibacter minnesotensis TaxID=1118379 RepID=A0A7I7R5R5_9MYCO|nr:tellurium resistance protein TerC [Mycolicibacter minnesotensis]ORB01032.1 tellurium resistance protein TerC [Mycolicibacter minnesotensis]BBY33446.1 putative membrane protein [Mycolicibacter minnesotensis]
MNVAGWAWGLTIVGLVGLLVFDFVFHVRQPHVPTLRESAVWSAGYVGIAVAFGFGMFAFGGVDAGSEYFAGYVTEKALSVDNLFVFLVIMARFRVPAAEQQRILLFGIILSLIARTGFIFVGVALINTFSWAFYVLGLILLLSAAGMLRSGSDHQAPTGDTAVTRLARKVARAPMLVVMLAIAGTDVIFALDSLPAIFGLTRDTYTVFTATAFALLGLRQLYFLVDGLLDRLVYLSTGLFVILAFIGAKLVLHGLHDNNLPFINDGRPVPVVEIGTGLSLLVIVGVLGVTVVASLLSGESRNQTAAVRDRQDDLVLRP